MIGLISPEDVKNSLLLVNKYEKLKIYTAWKQFFILFGLADILTSLMILISYSLKIYLVISVLWILLPILNLLLILLGIILVILSNKYKLGKLGLQRRINNKNAYSNKFYWELVLTGLVLMFISFFINFYTSIKYFNYVPNDFFLANPIFITGMILIFMYVIQKYLYNELNFKELFFFGLVFIIFISPLLFVYQISFFQKTSNSMHSLQTLLDPNNNSNFLIFLLTNLFLLPVFLISLFLIGFGLYTYYKSRKFTAFAFTGAGLISILFPLLYFLYEFQSLSSIPSVVLKIDQNAINGIFTSIIIIYLIIILGKGILLFFIGIFQSNKIKNL